MIPCGKYLILEQDDIKHMQKRIINTIDRVINDYAKDIKLGLNPDYILREAARRYFDYCCNNRIRYQEDNGNLVVPHYTDIFGKESYKNFLSDTRKSISSLRKVS